jgi:hypothetical protein
LLEKRQRKVHKKGCVDRNLTLKLSKIRSVGMQSTERYASRMIGFVAQSERQAAVILIQTQNRKGKQ